MSASIVSRCQIREGAILCKVEHVIHGNKDTQMKYRPCRFYWPIESNKSYSPEMQQCPCVMYPIPTWPLDNESNDDQASRNEWHGGIRITFTCNKEWIRCFSPHTKEDDLTLFQIQKLKKVEKRFDPFHFSSLFLSLSPTCCLRLSLLSHTMSFAQFANGAECGPTNPMAGLMKQFHQDRSLQQVRCWLSILAIVPIAHSSGHIHI